MFEVACVFHFLHPSRLPRVADGRDVGPAVPVLRVKLPLLVAEARVLHGLLHLQFLAAGVDPARRLLVLVVPVLEDEGDDSEADADEDDDKDAANVVDGDSAARIVVIVADHLLWVLVPPPLFQRLESSLIQELQDARKVSNKILIMRWQTPSSCRGPFNVIY